MEVKLNTFKQSDTIKAKAAKTAEFMSEYGDNTIVLFNDNSSYRAYGTSAEHLNTACNIPITFRDGYDLAEFESKNDWWVFPKLVRAGFKVAIIADN